MVKKFRKEQREEDEKEK